MLRLVSALALLLTLTACTLWKERRLATWSSATGPETHERLLWQEIAAGHWNEIEKHLSPTFRATLPGGTFDRGATLEAWKALPSRTAVLADMAVAPQGGAMVVTYNAEVAGSGWRMMTVWQETKSGEWMAIAHAEVPSGR